MINEKREKRESTIVWVSTSNKALLKAYFFSFLRKRRKILKEDSSLKTGKKYFDQLSGARSTQKLVKIHNNCFYKKRTKILNLFWRDHEKKRED